MSEKFGYTVGAIDDPDHLFIAGVEIELEDRDVPHAILFEYSAGEWSAWSVEFRLAGVACHSGNGFEFFAVGIDGQVEVTVPDDAWDETIDRSDDGPSDLRALSVVRIVGRHLYVAGMRRQVYRRLLGVRDSWERYDVGCLVPTVAKEVAGFNGLHGQGESCIYAVGYAGNIWYCQSGAWTQINSPTNLRLEVVYELASGDVLIGGVEGILLRGGRSGFRLIDHGATQDTFVSIAEAFGRIWLSTEVGGLFVLDGDALVPEQPPALAEEGGGRLQAVGQLLLYVGNQVAAVRDAKDWRDVTPPDN